MSLSLSQLQAKFLKKLDEKCTGAMTLPRLLRKHFQNLDLDNDGQVSISEWASVVERAGGAITPEEACALFEFWDSAGYTREPNGLIAISDAIASLMSSELTSESVFDRGQAPPSRGNLMGNQGNRPSAEGGIFGGGVYETDARQVARSALPAPDLVEQARQSDGPKGNQSSLEGGIFGNAPVEDTPRTKAITKNKSSVPGGIFGMDENSAPSAPQKRDANLSSIPGGIFG